MRHLAVKNNLINSESESNKLISGGGNDRPFCSKPRRLRHFIPEFLEPLRCSNHSQRNSDPQSGTLNMIAFSEKNIEGKECMCLPACYSGSPPERTDNPLVHDVQFSLNFISRH